MAFCDVMVFAIRLEKRFAKLFEVSLVNPFAGKSVSFRCGIRLVQSKTRSVVVRDCVVFRLVKFRSEHNPWSWVAGKFCPHHIVLYGTALAIEYRYSVPVLYHNYISADLKIYQGTIEESDGLV